MRLNTNQSASGSGLIAAHGGTATPALSSRSWTAASKELMRTMLGAHWAWYTLKVVTTRSLSGWFHWQAQQAERSEKVTEDEQHELAGGSRDVCCVVLVLVLVLVLVPVVLVVVLLRVGQRKLRSRKGSEAEDEQTWRTRWTTWPTKFQCVVSVLDILDGLDVLDVLSSLLTWILVIFVEHPS